MYTDPSGEFWHNVIGAVIGGVVNWATHGFKFSAQGLAYFGIGALAGAAGGFAVQAVAGALGTATTFGGSVANGVLIGTSGGFAGGFVGGAGNTWMNGADFGQGLGVGLIGGGYGALGGALIGGISGGILYQRQISVFQKGNAVLEIDGGKPVPVTDQFLSDAQKVWYKNAPMDKVKAFTVENVPDNVFVGEGADAAGATRAISRGGILTGRSNVYFNKDLAFSSAKQLFFTMGHEFVHVSQFAALAGQSASILTPDFISMLEFHAYGYQNSLGGLQLSSFTRDDVTRWATTYSQFNAMNYINFPWTFNHSFIYPF